MAVTAADTALRRLLDRAEIEQRKHAYLRAADDADPERMVARFTPDCTASYAPGQPVIEGRDSLREWYAHRIGDVVSSSHHLSNLEVEFDGDDTAHVRAYLYSWQRYDDFPEHGDRHCWARYVDTWVRTRDGWYQSALVYLLAHEVTTIGTPRCGEYLPSDAWRTGIA
jgi:uncharacterized protein (TIGR02246 family)